MTPQVERKPRVETVIPPGSVAAAPDDSVSQEEILIDTEDVQSKEARELLKLREDMGITESVDPLQALLQAPMGPPTDKWRCERLHTEFQVRALTTGEYNQVQDRATRWTRNKRTGRMEKDLDASVMSLLVVAAATVEPNFADPQILQRYRVQEGYKAVSQALLPGEIEAIAEKIMTLSGFDDELEEQGKDSSPATARPLS